MDEVQYTLTRDDFWRLHLYAISRQQRRTIRLRLILIGVIFVCLFIFLNQSFSGNYSRSILVVFFSLFLTLPFILILFGLLLLLILLATFLANVLLVKCVVNVRTISAQGVQYSNETK